MEKRNEENLEAFPIKCSKPPQTLSKSWSATAVKHPELLSSGGNAWHLVDILRRETIKSAIP